MKKTSVFLVLFTFFFSGLALADSGVVVVANISTDAGVVAVTPKEEFIFFQLPGQRAVSISTRQILIKTPDGKTKSAPAAQVLDAMRAQASAVKAAAASPSSTPAQKGAARAIETADNNMISALSTATSASIQTAITAAANPPRGRSPGSRPKKDPR